MKECDIFRRGQNIPWPPSYIFSGGHESWPPTPRIYAPVRRYYLLSFVSDAFFDRVTLVCGQTAVRVWSSWSAMRRENCRHNSPAFVLLVSCILLLFAGKTTSCSVMSSLLHHPDQLLANLTTLSSHNELPTSISLKHVSPCTSTSISQDLFVLLR